MSIKDSIKSFLLSDYPVKRYEHAFQSTTENISQIYSDVLNWIIKQDMEIINKVENNLIEFTDTSYSETHYIRFDFAHKPIFFRLKFSEESGHVNILGLLYIKDERDINRIVRQYYGILAECLSNIGVNLTDNEKKIFFTSEFKFNQFIRKTNIEISLILIFVSLIIIIGNKMTFNNINLIILSLLSGWFIFDLIKGWNYIQKIK